MIVVLAHVSCLWLLLLVHGSWSSMEFTRSSSGDTHIGMLNQCTGTLVVRDDDTFSIACAQSMNDPDADCVLFLNGTRKFGVISQELKITELTVTKTTPPSSFCQAGYMPSIGQVQLQDYPTSYNFAIWNATLGKTINKSLESSFNQNGNALTIKVWELFPGMLVRLYIDCKTSNGTIDPQQPKKQCVLFKYTGRATLPVVNGRFNIITVSPTRPTRRTTVSTTTEITIQTSDSTQLKTSIPPASSTDGQSTNTTLSPTAAPRSDDEGIPWIIILISVGAFLLLLLIIVIVILCCIKKRRKSKEPESAKEMESVSRDNPAFITVNGKPQSQPTAPVYAQVDKKNKDSSAIKGTGTIDSTDSSKVTSSAYLFMGKSPSSSLSTSPTKFDPVSLQIPLDEDNYNVL